MTTFYDHAIGRPNRFSPTRIFRTHKDERLFSQAVETVVHKFREGGNKREGKKTRIETNAGAANKRNIVLQ